MQLTTKEQTALVAQLRLIDVQLESLPLRDIPQTEQIFKAMTLSKERTGLRQRLVASL